jgi:SET family sugar efflux transporter-like MFS transporter
MAGPTTPSYVVRTILRQPGLSWSYLGILLAGSGASILFALLPVYAVRFLNAGPEQVGLYFTISTLVGIPATLVTGRLSDRSAHRRVFGCAILIWVAAGIVVASIVPTFTALMAVGVLMLSFVDSSNSQVLARGRSLLAHADGATATLAGSILRSGYSLGYVIGPLLAAIALGVGSARTALALSASVYLGALIGYLGPRSSPSTSQRPAEPRLPGTVSKTRLAVTCLAFVPIMMAPVVRAAYLVLYATEDRHLTLSAVMQVIAIAPVAEIVLIPLCGAAAARLGQRAVIVTGAVAAAVEMGLISLATATWQLLLLQILGAFVLACQAGVGMAYLQDKLASQPGFGTSLYFASRAVASAVGAGLGGLVASAYGYHAVFLVAAAVAVLGAVALAVVVKPVNEVSRPTGTERSRSSHG